MGVQQQPAADHLRAAKAAGRRLAKAEAEVEAARAHRDEVLRSAVDAGNRIDDVAPLVGLTPASARWVLYGKAKRKGAA